MDKVRYIDHQDKDSLELIPSKEWMSIENTQKSDASFSPEEIREKDQIYRGKKDYAGDDGTKNELFSEYTLERKLFWLFIEYFFAASNTSLKEFLDSIERDVILRTLIKVNGKQKRAAEVLGVKYTTLNEKIKKYKIRLPRS